MRIWITYTQEYLGGGELLDPEEEWSDRADEEYSWDLDQVSIGEPARTYNDRVRCGVIDDGKWVDQDVEIGDSVFVVCVIYATGDTFGQTLGQGTVVCVCKDARSAEFLSKQIHNGDKPECISFAPWHGYFESLTDVRIEPRIILR